jgi:hypothetical protein
VVLSAQATDAGVNKATRALFQAADTPQKMLDLGEERVRDHVKSINFFRTKAKNVIALSQRLVDEFGGEVPPSVEILETLPGVGRKTASVVVNMAFGIPRIAVDTHIFRVSNRIPAGLDQGAAGNAGGARGHHAGRIPAPRPPLAHPARALHLQGAAARMLALPDPGPVPLRAEILEPQWGGRGGFDEFRLKPCSAPRAPLTDDGGEDQPRLRHWRAPRVQAMPGVEQAGPCAVRWQTTQPSVHSAQPGAGSAATGRTGAGQSASTTASVATASATLKAVTMPMLSSRFCMGDP